MYYWTKLFDYSNRFLNIFVKLMKIHISLENYIQIKITLFTTGKLHYSFFTKFQNHDYLHNLFRSRHALTWQNLSHNWKSCTDHLVTNMVISIYVFQNVRFVWSDTLNGALEMYSSGFLMSICQIISIDTKKHIP